MRPSTCSVPRPIKVRIDTGWTDKEIQVAADRACDARGVGGFLNTPEWLRLFLRELGASRGLPAAPPTVVGDVLYAAAKFADKPHQLFSALARFAAYHKDSDAEREMLAAYDAVGRARTALGEGRPE